MSARTPVALLSLDAIAVIVFAIAGRRSHGHAETTAGTLDTAWPFLVGLLVAWLVARAWKAPISLPGGVIVVAITVFAGMVLRVIFTSGGAAVTFVIVATGVLAVLMLGWRLVARGITAFTAAKA